MCAKKYAKFLRKICAHSNKNVADVATACSFLLNNLNNDETLDLNLQDSICKDALQSRLLSGLKTSLEVIPNDDTSRWLLINARVVTICTKLCRNRSKSVHVILLASNKSSTLRRIPDT